MDQKSQIREFVTSNFYVPDGTSITDGASLLEQGLIDSTGMLELIGFLEGSFHVKVEDAEMVPENLDSIDRIAAFLERKSEASA